MGSIVTDRPTTEDPIESAAQDYLAGPNPTYAQGMAAMYHDTSVSEALYRSLERGQYEGSSGWDRAMFQISAMLPSLPTGGAMGPVMSSPTGWQQDPDIVTKPTETPMLSADEVNRRFAPPGTKITSVPMREGVARLVGEARTAEVNRDQVLERFSEQHSWATQFVMGAAAFMLDPANATLTAIPGLGEEAIMAGAARVGLRLSSSWLGRAGASFVASGIAGAAPQIPLSAARYALGQEEASDYGLRQAFNDVFFGAALGAAIHTGLGAVTGKFRVRDTPIAPAMDPRINSDAMRSAMAQIMEGRPIDVRAVFDEAEAQRVGRALRLTSEIGQRRAQLEAMPQGDPAARERLDRLSVVENELRDPSLEAGDRKKLMDRRDELLTDTNPDELKAKAAPLEQRRALEAEIANLERERGMIDVERDQAAHSTLDPEGMSRIESPAELSAQMTSLYEGGFSQGMGQTDWARMQEWHEAYESGAPLKPAAAVAEKVGAVAEKAAKAGKASEAGAEGAKPGEASPLPGTGSVKPEIASDLQRLQRMYEQRMQGVKGSPEERAEVEQTMAKLEHSEFMGQAYATAAQCLVEAGV